MTPFLQKLEALEKLERAATPGPWNHEEERYSAKNVIGVKPADDRWVASCQPEFNGHGNAEFIAESRNALPKLLQDMRRMYSALEKIGYPWPIEAYPANVLRDRSQLARQVLEEINGRG